MRRSLCNTLRIFLALAVALSFLAGTIKSVQAVTCEWEGDQSTDWFAPANWTCEHVPVAADEVSISSGTLNQPTIGQMQSVTVSTITINAGATLTILDGSAVNANTWTAGGNVTANTAASLIYINIFTPGGVVNVGPTGSITKLGTGDLIIYSTFNNAGTVSGAESGTYDGGVVLIRGGAHTGIFQGVHLYIGNNDEASGQVFNFNSESQLRVNQLHARGGTVNLFGSISQPENTGTALFVQPSNGTSVVYFKTGLGILKMPETTFIENGGKLILEAQSNDYSMKKLNLEYNGELQNLDNLNITTQFNWLAGKLTGNGTTTVDATATFTMGTSGYPQNDFTLDEQRLVNNTTANWIKRDLTLANAAEFINYGTFNANATTTMNGGETVTFTNNGTFFKNTPATTTTMNVGFINDGDVQINEGNLEFPLGMDNGDDTTIVLNGGRLDPGDELLLESGDSLIGSGTLTANLVNAGTVSPGASPGIITVDGDYTQQADGILEIQLGGTTPSLFDRLIVTGAASMAGTLNVTLLPGFSPQEGDTFFIVNHLTSGTGNFSIENLPDLPGSLMFEIDYADPGVTLTVVSRSTDTFIFLPMIIK